jgi:hypothetical protein
MTGITSNITVAATFLTICLLGNLHLTHTVCAIRPSQEGQFIQGACHRNLRTIWHLCNSTDFLPHSYDAFG